MRGLLCVVSVFLFVLFPPRAGAAPSGGDETGGSGYIDTHMHLDGMYMKKRGAIKARRRPLGDRPSRRERGVRPKAWDGKLPRAETVKDFEAAAANLIAEMDRRGVSMALIMPPPQKYKQKFFYDYWDILPVVKKHKDRLAMVAGGGTLNPIIHSIGSSDVPPAVRDMFEDEAERLVGLGARGFGEMTALHLCMNEKHHYLAASPDHSLFLFLADIAARHDVPIDMHMEAVPKDIPLPAGLDAACSKNPSVLKATIPPFERLLAYNRDTRIVWQHIGWDNTGYMTVDLLRRLLRKHPNLYLSLRVEARERTRGGEPMPNRVVDEKGKLRLEWLKLISDFPDRFMIGGDEFVGIPGRTPRRPQSFEETWRILDQLPPEIAGKVGHDNAARVYRLD